MSSVRTLSKSESLRRDIAPAAPLAEAGLKAGEARAGRLAFSRELRDVGRGTVARAFTNGRSDACALCTGDGGAAALLPRTAEAEREAPAERLSDGPRLAPAETERTVGPAEAANDDRARTSGAPNDDQVLDEMVQDLNEDDAAKQQEGDSADPAAAPDAAAPSAGPAPGGTAPAQAGSAPAASHLVAETAPATPAAADAHTLIVNGQAVGDGEIIPGSFRPASGVGAALDHSGHSLDSCLFAHAGTNSWAKPAGFPGTLGLTTVTNAFTGPRFDIETTQRQKVSATPSLGGFIDWALGTGPTEWVATVKSTTSTDATHPCVSSPAGEHKTGTRMVNVGGTPTPYETFLNITPAYAGKIWAAEDEHLSDALHAYNISLKRAADEVNRLAGGSAWVADTEADAKAGPEGALRAAMPAKLGIDPANWRAVVWQLCLLTISGRDALGWHTFHSTEQAPDHGAKKIVSTLSDGTTQIGSHATPSVVDLSKLP